MSAKDAGATPIWRVALTVILASLILNAALTFENLWPTPAIKLSSALSPEILALVGGLAVWVAVGRVIGARQLRWIAAVLLLAILARYLQVTVPALFGRPINLYWDGRHLPQVMLLALSELPPLHALLLVLGSLAGIGLFVWLMIRFWSWVLARLCAAFAVPTVSRGVAALALSLLLLWAMGRVGGVPMLARLYSQPVTAAYLEQAWFLARALSPGAVDRLLPASPAYAEDVEALHGADVLLLFLESYGSVTRDHPQLAEALRPARERLARATQEAGFGAVSAFVRSPTFGGGSWLAHASLLSGLAMDDPALYHLLLTTDRRTLVDHFHDQGYETVGWMPGLHKDWPEGSFYGYDRIVDADALEYPGPIFGFWRIPDQYSIARLADRELREGPRKPRFIVFPTITSHVPFRPLPPYVRDSARLLHPDAFDPEAVRRALAQAADWSNLTPGYTAGIDYTLRWLADFLVDDARGRRTDAGGAASNRHRPARPLVIIALGDHQPAGSITGPGASWDVPVHVFARDPVLLARLETAGFTRGLQARRAPLGHMAGLTETLSAVFAKPRVDVAGAAGPRGTGREPGADLIGAPPARHAKAQ